MRSGVNPILFSVLCLVGSAIVLIVGTTALGDDADGPCPNPVVFWELAAHDGDRSIEFFREVFEWKIEKDPNSIVHYTHTKGEEAGIYGGIFTLQRPKLPFVAVYIQVDDMDAKVKAIEAAGGMIVEPPKDFGTGTEVCLFNDPSGVTFAMLERGDPGD